MRLGKKAIGLIFLCLLTSGVQATIERAVPVFLLVNAGNKGELSQMQGVASFLPTTWPVRTIPVNKLEQTLAKLKGEAIFISSGNYGVNALKKVKATSNLYKTVHISHQKLSSTDELIKKHIDLLALPSYVETNDLIELISQEKSHTKVITTDKVAHNLQIADLKTSYQKHKNEIAVNKPLCVVILAGDVELANGKWQLYSAKEAVQYAEFIARFKEQRDLLILNGPRTGKHLADCQEDKAAHRNNKSDKVTAAFIAELKKQGIKVDEIKLFDFQYNKPSYYQPVLGALLAAPKNSVVVVPGESSSMMAEVIDTLSQQVPVAVYSHSAMTKVHTLGLENEYNNGNIAKLYYDESLKSWVLQHQLPAKLSQVKEPAAETIAKAIVQLVEKSS